MFFEPRPGENCAEWSPNLRRPYGPQHSQPKQIVLGSNNPAALETELAALTDCDHLLILAISAAGVTDVDGLPYFYQTVLYQELLTPQGNAVSDEGDDQ